MKNKNLNITLHTSCLRVYHNCQPRQLAIQISLIPHFTTHFTTRYKIGQLTIQLTIQLTSKLDTITQISTRSTTHFTTHSNSTHPCTTHHLAIPWSSSFHEILAQVYQSISCGLIIVVEVPKVNQIIRDPTNPRLYTVYWLTAYIY